MKATEAIEKLQKLLNKYGDQDIWIEYDGGVRRRIDEIENCVNETSNIYGDVDTGDVTGFLLYETCERL